MEAGAKQRGRPRKTGGTEQQIKQREYMRKYQSEIKQGIVELEKAEMECLKELEKLQKDKKKLIDELAKAGTQAEEILKESVGKKNQIVPKPNPKSESAKILQAATRRKMAMKY